MNKFWWLAQKTIKEATDFFDSKPWRALFVCTGSIVFVVAAVINIVNLVTGNQEADTTNILIASMGVIVVMWCIFVVIRHVLKKNSIGSE